MSLTSKAAKNKSLEEALVKEDKLAPVISSRAAPTSQQEIVQAAPVIQHPIMLNIVETVTAHLRRDGGVTDHEIKGSLTLAALTDEDGLCQVQMRTGRNVGDFTFSTHPKLNKAAYDKNNLLVLKDPTKGFPSQRPVGILKWSYAGTNENVIPLQINCWPEEEGRGITNVNIEYTMTQAISLHNVQIRIPLGTSESINILSVDGTTRHLPRDGELIWEIQLIDQSNTSGSLEFKIAQKNQDAFFPIAVSFHSTELFCNVDVAKVIAADGSTPIQYGLTKNMSTEEYIIS